MKERAKFLYLIIFEQAVVKTTPISLYIWDLPFRVKRRVMNGPLYKTNPNSNIVWPFPTKCGAKEPGNSGHKATDLVTCEINYPAVQMRAILPRFSKSRSTISKSPQWTKCRLEKVPILLRTERLLFELAAVATAATFSLLQILQHLLSAGHWGSLFKVLASEVPQVPEDFCVSPVLPTQPLTTSRCLDSLDESHHFLYSHSPQRLIRRSSLYRISPVALIPRHDIRPCNGPERKDGTTRGTHPALYDLPVGYQSAILSPLPSGMHRTPGADCTAWELQPGWRREARCYWPCELWNH